MTISLNCQIMEILTLKQKANPTISQWKSVLQLFCFASWIANFVPFNFNNTIDCWHTRLVNEINIHLIIHQQSKDKNKETTKKGSKTAVKGYNWQ